MKLSRRKAGTIRVLAAVAIAAACAFAAAADAQAQEGRWSGSIGVAFAGGADDPFDDATGPEAALWFVLSDKVDLGGRVGSFTFDSDGLTFPEAPLLVPGEGKIVPFEVALRYFPGGSSRTVFPLLGLSVLVPLSDSFDAERVALPDELGVFLDTDWEVDSVGFGAEAGLRWDVSESFFLEFSGRYVVLGAESIGTVEVVPEVVETRVVDTNLDGFRAAVHLGFYF
jgi:opacity protein-like surface antigen